jgi:site-specific DNA-methyltransferase (adenine-specific)
MRFDVIIGNPPYQLSDGGGTGDSAIPIYHLFTINAIQLRPRFLSFVIPSRWMKGGKGLDTFREFMINQTKIGAIYDFEDAKKVFPSINLDGGVMYFLWDLEHSGMTKYTIHKMDGEVLVDSRILRSSFTDKIIRDSRQLKIVEKVMGYKYSSFSEIVSYRNPYGLAADLFNKMNSSELAKIETVDKNKIVVYGVIGKKGGAKRVKGYIERNKISKNLDSIEKYKLFFSKAFTTTATVPPEIILGYPGSVSTETFLEIGPFDSEDSMLNCLKYIKTKFFRALLYFNRHSLNISKSSFDLIPLISLDKNYNDDYLYNLFELSKDEIDLIENQISRMD